MTRLTRRTRPAVIAAALVALASSGVANAAISGTIVNKAGVPLDSVGVELLAANASSAGFTTTKVDGTFTVTPFSGTTGPFTIRLNESDACRDFNDPARVQKLDVPGIADGATGVAVTLDLRDFCAGNLPFGATPSPVVNGLVDGVLRRIVAPPGGTVFVRVLRPSGAVDAQVVLQDGTRISPPLANAFNDIQVVAPAAGYNGPISLVFGTSGGATVTRNMGTLVAQPLTQVTPSPGVPYDIEAIVDVSGSMSGTDPKFLRKDAINLLADLSGTADGLGAVGFDSDSQPIFDLTQTTTQAIVNQLKAKAKTQIINRGGTNYNVGMDKAWEALNAPGVDPNKPKVVIFLTDGGHNGPEYANGHLRFAYPGLFNGVTQRPWPVCAVQLGSPASFQADDVARLQRIASETGGKYFATQSSTDLNDIYFRCRGQSTGQRALVTKNVVFARAGQQRQFGRTLPKNLKQATFFVNTGGTFVAQVALIDPTGRRITQSTRQKGIVFRRGGTFAFYRITKPRAGSWRILVKAVRLTEPKGKGQVSITVPTR